MREKPGGDAGRAGQELGEDERGLPAEPVDHDDGEEVGGDLDEAGEDKVDVDVATDVDGV